MSAYKVLECDFVDKTTLLSALRELGLSYQEPETPVKLQGFIGDTRNQEAEIVVPRSELNKAFTRASNDLGFRWNAEKEQYDMICSDYDMAYKIPQRVAQAYIKVAIEAAFKENRFEVNDKTAGSIKERRRVRVSIVGTKLV